MDFENRFTDSLVIYLSLIMVYYVKLVPLTVSYMYVKYLGKLKIVISLFC